jgi:Transcription factor WhiB
MNMSQIKEAKQICKTCPVIAECLASALINRENYGIWGGTTGRTRQKIRAGIESGVFSFAQVIEDYKNWEIRRYETYKADA